MNIFKEKEAFNFKNKIYRTLEAVSSALRCVCEKIILSNKQLVSHLNILNEYL